MGQSRLPDFLGLGVQKGGTTTLHTLLAAHPQLMLPQKKELHFFRCIINVVSSGTENNLQKQNRISSAVKSLPTTSFIPWCRSVFSTAVPMRD